MRRPLLCLGMLLVLLAASCAAPQRAPSATAAPAPAIAQATATAAPTLLPQATAEAPAALGDPQALVSQERLFATLEDLTAIRPGLGWRSSGTLGEAEALDYVAGRLDELAYLRSLGLEQERQHFRIYLSMEHWEARLALTAGGRAIEVPANGLRGARDNIAQALTLDSDGALNDTDRNPLTGEGVAVVIHSAADLERITPAAVRGKVVLLDYAAVDRTVVEPNRARGLASAILNANPAGVVLITAYSNRPGESHGTFVGEGSVIGTVKAGPTPPVLYTRLEDLAPAGIATWDDLARVESARLTWDGDVVAPATSGNLVAHIPGADPSRALILGAHVDSPNVPGAMDDGSGVAALLEVARVLDEARMQPPLDLYLAWFGSEEAGLFGSAHFAATHQELLDRTQAMLQIDCLTRPLDGVDAMLTLMAWPYSRLGQSRLPWPQFLADAAGRQGLRAYAGPLFGIDSDNNSFDGFGVPTANLGYFGPRMEQMGVHYAGHLHDPYDTVALAREVAPQLEQMARIALLAVLGPLPAEAELRVALQPQRRAVFVASHTEAVHMTPAALIDLGMALTWEGYDVDLVPYGQTVTAADLQGAALVVALPVLDYPSPGGDPALYDEAWQPAEVTALESYVAEGGLLVLTNSAHRLKYMNMAMDINEDWSDANALAGRFGISYQEGEMAAGDAWVEGTSPLLEGLSSLRLVERNGVPLSLAQGRVLAQAGGWAAAGLVDQGRGQVLALADLGLLGAAGEPANLAFWRNLARYAAGR
ncbi:MAG TPA: M28 family peptidase [Anaerolineae bacterium]|nr:M28 family peptidase [Anaerolineae bacterium]